MTTAPNQQTPHEPPESVVHREFLAFLEYFAEPQEPRDDADSTSGGSNVPAQYVQQIRVSGQGAIVGTLGHSLPLLMSFPVSSLAQSMSSSYTHTMQVDYSHLERFVIFTSLLMQVSAVKKKKRKSQAPEEWFDVVRSYNTPLAQLVTTEFCRFERALRHAVAVRSAFTLALWLRPNMD